jgi:hypothetical protein
MLVLRSSGVLRLQPAPDRISCGRVALFGELTNVTDGVHRDPDGEVQRHATPSTGSMGSLTLC